MNTKLKAVKLMFKNMLRSKLTWFILMWLICVIVVTSFNLNLVNINFTMPYALRICLGCLIWAMLFIAFPVMACVVVITIIVVVCHLLYKNYKYYLQQVEKEDEE